MDWVSGFLGLIGAATGVIALVLQRRQDSALDQERRRERAGTVTAQWITRELERPDSLGTTKEFGLWVRNHGRVPVHNVQIEATAKDAPCVLPTLDPLQSGEMFIRKNRSSSNSDFDVRRMGANVVSTEPIYKPSWRVDRVSFNLDGIPVTWSAK